MLWHEEAGAGPALVLLHAGICDSRMWDAQWQPLARSGYRVVRCDFRGYGRSALPPGTFSNAGDVLDVLDGLGLERAALAGASLGARVALEVALARPELVASLVVAGATLPGQRWSEAVRGYGAAEDAALERGDLDAAVELNLRMWVDGLGRRPEDVDPAVRSAVAEMQRAAFERWLPMLDEAEEQLLVPDLAGRLGEILAPALVVVGEADAPDVHDAAARLRREIPIARQATIPGAAHVPNMERPAEFEALLLGFLGSHA